MGTGRGPRWAWLRSLSRDVRERFGAFIDALRTLAGLGLLPMLALCLILLLLVRVPVLASYVVRGLLGPMRTQTWLGIAPIEASATAGGGSLAAFRCVAVHRLCRFANMSMARMIARRHDAPEAISASRSTARNAPAGYAVS